MAYAPAPPAPLAKLAQRETWFAAHDAQKVLDWLEAREVQLLGVDVARTLPDGNWMLLLDPMYDGRDGVTVTIETARRFINENTAPDLMFELVW